jgi:hypothetical protein
MLINEGRAKRRGRNTLSDPRTHCVSVRLNSAELALLNSKRNDMKQGEWLRCAALDKLPFIIPEPNKEKWVELVRAAANLNHIAKACNVSHGIPDKQFAPVRKILNEFRKALLGVS